MGSFHLSERIEVLPTVIMRCYVTNHITTRPINAASTWITTIVPTAVATCAALGEGGSPRGVSLKSSTITKLLLSTNTLHLHRINPIHLRNHSWHSQLNEILFF